MTIFDELAKLAVRFRSVKAVTASTNRDELSDLAEQALRFVQRARDLCGDKDLPQGMEELDQVQAKALHLQHQLRKIQTQSTLRGLRIPATDVSAIAECFEDLFGACKSVCEVHNCILVDWWEVATNHA